MDENELDRIKFNALTWWMFGRSKAAAVFYTACIIVTTIALPLMVVELAQSAPWWATVIVTVAILGYVLAHMSQLDAIEELLTRLLRQRSISPADLTEVDRASQD